MKNRVIYHEGPFPGLRVTQGNLPVAGSSLEFLAFLSEKTQRGPASRNRLDSNLQRLLTHYRECFAVQQAA